MVIKILMLLGLVLEQKINNMKKTMIGLLILLPTIIFAQQRDTTWKKHFRMVHTDLMHRHMIHDTLYKMGDEIEYRKVAGMNTINEPGWKVLLHKLPKDTVIFLDHNNKIIPYKPVWEADTDWYLKFYKHHKSKIDSL